MNVTIEFSVICFRIRQFVTASDRDLSVGCEKSTFLVQIYEIYFLHERCDSLNCCNTRFVCNMMAVSTVIVIQRKVPINKTR